MRTSSFSIDFTPSRQVKKILDLTRKMQDLIDVNEDFGTYSDRHTGKVYATNIDPAFYFDTDDILGIAKETGNYTARELVYIRRRYKDEETILGSFDHFVDGFVEDMQQANTYGGSWGDVLIPGTDITYKQVSTALYNFPLNSVGKIHDYQIYVSYGKFNDLEELEVEILTDEYHYPIASEWIDAILKICKEATTNREFVAKIKELCTYSDYDSKDIEKLPDIIKVLSDLVKNMEEVVKYVDAIETYVKNWASNMKENFTAFLENEIDTFITEEFYDFHSVALTKGIEYVRQRANTFKIRNGKAVTNLGVAIERKDLKEYVKKAKAGELPDRIGSWPVLSSFELEGEKIFQIGCHVFILSDVEKFTNRLGEF